MTATFDAFFDGDVEEMTARDETDPGDDMVVIQLQTREILNGKPRRRENASLRLFLTPGNAMKLIDTLASAVSKVPEEQRKGIA